MSTKVEWSQYRERSAGNAKPAEAIASSAYREAFMHQLEQFEVRANRFERIIVQWWHAPYLYVEVRDDRKDYPVSCRALISFDLTNGKWASPQSGNRYVLARRGWRTFLDILSGVAVDLSPEGAVTAST